MHAAAVAAVANLVPAPFPFLPPGERSATDGAAFMLQRSTNVTWTILSVVQANHNSVGSEMWRLSTTSGNA
jgi:hypothetical protein